MNLSSSLLRVLDGRSASTKALLVGSLLSFAMPLCLKAHVVTPKEAENIARKYIKLPTKKVTRGVSKQSGYSQNAPYYIYNDAQNKGFVIVSGTTEMGEILAYSNENALDTINLHPGLAQLLNSYKMAFKAINTNNAVETEAKKGAFFAKTVAPLLKTTWSQDAPYNALLGYNYTGCVATTISQVLKYHEWPVQGMGNVSYVNTSDNRTLSGNLNLSQYDWANMLPNYDAPVQATQAQRNAVAKLMKDVGLASGMQYHPGFAVATNQGAFDAFVKHFDYQATCVYQSTEGPSVFADLLRQELVDGFPFYFYGATKDYKGAHAWVVDGFDDKGFFHMNFGWNGQSNGYYSLSALNLSQSGKEFNGAKLAFSRAFMAIFAHPNKTGVKRIDPSLMPERGNLSFTAEGAFTRKDGVEHISNRMETYPVELSYIINKGLPFKGDVGVTVIDEQNNRVATAASQWHNEGGFTQQFFTGYGDGKMQTDGILSTPISVNVPLKGLKEGVYTLKVVSADYQDDNTWTDWVLLRKAPYMVIKVTADKVEVLEECSKTSSFKLVAEPFYDKTLNPGAKVTCNMAIKNLSGLPKDAYIKLSFLNDQGVAVFSQTSDKAFSFDSFGTDYAQFEMKLPTNLASGTYQTKVEVVNMYNADDVTLVKNPLNSTSNSVTIEGEVISPFFTMAFPSVSNSDGEGISSEKINLNIEKVLSYGFLLNAAEGHSYSGPLSIVLEDVITQKQIQVGAKIAHEDLVAGEMKVINVGQVQSSSLKVLNKRSYKWMVMGEKNGVPFNLLENQEDQYYVTFEGSKTTNLEYLTGIFDTQSVENTAQRVVFDGAQWNILGENITDVVVYGVDGKQLLSIKNSTNLTAPVALPIHQKGIFVVRWNDNGKWFTQKIVSK
ncbi:C10 family peptidase [Hoylesella nanceiensis]|uniref:C10 family peptidase n=1 Tax=Hoylesella nanceiensis TaxID=425941 RepID=UPI0028D6FB84|nr:C10 family peptidase [Hoylesella nanceiensis]